MASDRPAALAVRNLGPADLGAVAHIDELHTGSDERANWARIFARFVGAPARTRRAIALGSDDDGELAGYLFGEVRAVEFGSAPCGWVFAVGVAPWAQRRGVASALLAAAAARFRRASVRTVRTMVRRSDVPVLAFFRRHGFTGGAFLPLELDLLETRT